MASAPTAAPTASSVGETVRVFAAPLSPVASSVTEATEERVLEELCLAIELERAKELCLLMGSPGRGMSESRPAERRIAPSGSVHAVAPDCKL
jgi:hypothetical protein